MFSKNFTRLLMIACAAILIVFGIYQFGQRNDPATAPLQPARPLQAQAADLQAIPDTTLAQTPVANFPENGPSVEDSPRTAAIPAFRQWAETAAASGFAQADETKGMELAKARSAAMKTLIQQNPASALRQALPVDLRASLPPLIATAIEQPVKKTGMCSIRISCNHSSDAPHNGCQETPVLLEDGYDWNAYYASQQWRSYVGQSVGFEGVAVDGELAVQGITPISDKTKP